MIQDTYSAAAGLEIDNAGVLHVLFAGASQTPASHKLGPKVYDYYLLHYVEQGQGEFVTEWSRYTLTAGDCFLIEPNQLVSYASDTVNPWRYRWIAFNGSGAAELVRHAGFTPEIPVFHGTADNNIPNCLRMVLETFRSKSQSSHLESLGYLYLIMGEARKSLMKEPPHASGESGIQRTVKQMIHHMSSQYAHPVSIEQMCAGLGYNRAYLSRIFKRETGMAPVTYLLKLRIDKSRQLLRDRPELSIEQISASVGLADALYFSRQFRRLQGMSPSEYRKKNTL